jgi:uncharacterized membrane protein
MKTRSLVQSLLVVLLALAPFIYTAFIWQDMPDNVATHFEIGGKPDAFGSKSKTLLSIVLIMILGLGQYFFFKNKEIFDPKRAKHTSRDAFDKINLLSLFFTSALCIYIVYSASNNGTGDFLSVLLGLFFAGMGNFMHSIPPNYFVGFRLPWTMVNDDNWRKTHQLGGKVWFCGGLVIAASALFLGDSLSSFFQFGTLTLMTFIPVVYSYGYSKRMA